MSVWKNIAIDYVDYLLKTGQIDESDWETTIVAILDGDIGISKSWLIENVYEGDIETMEAECGTSAMNVESFGTDDGCYVCNRDVSYGADTGKCDNCGVVFHYPNCDRGAGHSDDPMSHYCSSCAQDIVWRAETFEANYNPNQARDSKGRWIAKKPSSDKTVSPLEGLFDEDDEEYTKHLQDVAEEMIESGELTDSEIITPTLEATDIEKLLEYIDGAINDDLFVVKYMEDIEFQDYFHNIVWSTDKIDLEQIKGMFETMSAMASLTTDSHFINFADRGELISRFMLDVKKQQETYAAESRNQIYEASVHTDECTVCAGFADLKDLAPHYEAFNLCDNCITKATSFNAESFEAMSNFPPGKHDVIDAEKALKQKNSHVTKINSYEYLILQEGTSNKFHVFFDTNSGYYSVYGRIGYASNTGRVVGPMSYSKYYDKIRQKLRKGYQKMKV